MHVMLGMFIRNVASFVGRDVTMRNSTVRQGMVHMDQVVSVDIINWDFQNNLLTPTCFGKDENGNWPPCSDWYDEANLDQHVPLDHRGA